METAHVPNVEPGIGSKRFTLPRGTTLQEYTLLGVIVALIVVGAILKPDTFPTIDNFRAILTQSSVVGVLAIGMTFVIATAGIDLSVGSIVAAAGVAAGLMVDNGGAYVFILVALGFGLLLGSVNATAIAYGKVVPFIATLAMLAIARGLALQMSDKSADQPARLRPAPVVRHRRDHRPAGLDRDLRRCWRSSAGSSSTAPRFGRHVVSVGGNREAARIAGVPVRRTVFAVYAISGLLAGVATILLSGRLASASPVSGELLELDAIGATVIGGTSLAGGRATMTGTFMGVIVFGLIFNLLTQLDLATEWQQIVKGVIILVAVLIQRPERI